MKFIIIGLFIFGGLQTWAFSSNRTYSAKSVDYIKIKNFNGEIKVINSASELIKVEFEKVKFKNCKIKQEVRAKILDVAIDKGDQKGDMDCDVKIILKAPLNIGVLAKSASGNIIVADRQGSVKVNTGSGSVNLTGLSNTVSAKAGSGDITLSGSFTNVRLYSGNGNIKATYEKVPKGSRLNARAGGGNIEINYEAIPEAGEAEIKSGSGAVKLTLPKGSTIKSELKSGSGNVSNVFKNNLKSKYSIVVKTGSGNISLLGK